MREQEQTTDRRKVSPPGLQETQPASATPDVSVIIVSYNTCDLMRQCLESIGKGGGIQDQRLEVIVVDNASTDGTSEMIRENFSDVQLIVNKENRLFSPANNQACQVATGRNILFLNPDTIVQENAIQGMSDFLDRNPNAGAVGCRLLNPDGTLQPSCRDFPSNVNLLRQHCFPWRLLGRRFARLGAVEYWQHDAVRSVDWVIGACLMVSRKCLDDVGLKDEAFAMYHEETDWCYRAHRRGWKVMFVPDMSVVHYGGMSAQDEYGDSYEQVLRYYRAKHVFFRKHYGELSLFVYRSLISILSALRMLALVPSMIRGKRTPQVRRKFDFLKQAIIVQWKHDL